MSAGGGVTATPEPVGGLEPSDDVTLRFFRAARPVWRAQAEHPFVKGVGDGSLEIERFRRWVVQDYLYLKDFARIFAWAAARADRLEAMGWYAAVLDLTLNTEMDLHRSYARRFDLTDEDLESAEAWPTTRAYTDFLVRTAAEGEMSRLLAALLPCAWGYAWVAARLAEAGVPDDARYADWIRQYTSEEFLEATAWLRRETNRQIRGRADEDDLARLEETFVLSSRYELRFWEMCWSGEAWGTQRS